VQARDAARFVGRAAELARLEALVGDDPPVNVVLLHGPAGVGKSAMVRELARRAGLSRSTTSRMLGMSRPMKSRIADGTTRDGNARPVTFATARYASPSLVISPPRT